MPIKSAIFTILVGASILCSIAPADAKIRPLTCGGGSAGFYQDPINAQVGFGRSPNFLVASSPDFAGASSGMDVDGLVNQEFEGLALTTLGDDATINNTVVRFCFRDRNRNVLTVEKPISRFERRSDFRGYIERWLPSSAFNEQAIRDNQATLTRFTVVLKSGSRPHTLGLGRIFIDTSSFGSEPKEIENRDVGCSALECSNPKKEVRKNLIKDKVARIKAKHRSR